MVSLWAASYRQYDTSLRQFELGTFLGFHWYITSHSSSINTQTHSKSTAVFNFQMFLTRSVSDLLFFLSVLFSVLNYTKLLLLSVLPRCVLGAPGRFCLFPTCVGASVLEQQRLSVSETHSCTMLSNACPESDGRIRPCYSVAWSSRS
jgi:hypothetical protein